MMPKIFSGSAFFLLFSFLITSCGTTLPTASSYRQQELQQPVALSGEFTAMHDSLLFVRVSHTDTDVQVQLLVGESPVIARLLMMGVTIWIDRAATSQQDAGVVFPGAGTPVPPRQQQTIDRTPRRDRQEEVMITFDPYALLESVNKRNKVFRKGERAEFIDGDIARAFIDDDDNLNYVITIPFEKLEIAYPGTNRISVGIVSELPTMQADPEGRQAPAGVRGQPGYRRPYDDTARPRQQMQPIESWVIFNLE